MLQTSGQLFAPRAVWTVARSKQFLTTFDMHAKVQGLSAVDLRTVVCVSGRQGSGSLLATIRLGTPFRQKNLNPLNIVRRRGYRPLPIQAVGKFFLLSSALAELAAPQGLGKSRLNTSMCSRSIVLRTLRSRSNTPSACQADSVLHPPVESANATRTFIRRTDGQPGCFVATDLKEPSGADCFAATKLA